MTYTQIFTTCLAIGLTSVVMTLGNVTTSFADGQTCLNDYERKVEAEFPQVSSLTPHQFGALLAEPQNILIFDAREVSEFDVSHLTGAHHVDPDMTADAFLKTFGHLILGKTVLLYCSVGVRSSRLAQRIDAKLREKGAKGAFNLRGGIFAMHNYGFRLSERTGATDWVHPYSQSWARYLDFPNYSRFSPITR